jgi:hypothetical protein
MIFQNFCNFLEFEINTKTLNVPVHTLVLVTDRWDLVQVTCHEGNDQVKHVRGAHGHVISTGGLTPAVRRRRRRRYKAPPDARFVSIEREEDGEHYGGGGTSYRSPELHRKLCPAAVHSGELSIASHRCF